ncbi:MAG: hypothetical protein IT258_22915 [Saprospiraceae bacterium]|nr:hypothetical protein [Saprospiraceae bacterium]
MNIISLGLTIKYASKYKVTRIDFNSTQTLLDADVIFWDVKSFEDEFALKSQLRNEAESYYNNIKRRKHEFSEFFKLGRTLVITSPSFLDYTFDTSKQLNFVSILPIEKPITIEKSGTSIQANNMSFMQEFLERAGKYLHYNYEFQRPVGVPIMFIKDTKYVVSQFINIENGLIVFLPNFKLPTSDVDTHIWFCDLILTLIDDIKAYKKNEDISKKIETPEWAKKIEILGEKNEKEALLLLLIQKMEIESKIKTHETKLKEYNHLKILFTGTGEELEGIVRLVFLEMGFQIEEPEKGRDDLIIHHGDFVAVIEAKGVDGSSGEKHAAQLQKWVSAYHEKQEKEPKGILIANTFRKIPLHERTQEDFPHQMLKYVERMRHCLMTGIQLLYLLLDFRSGKLTIEDIVTRLSETVGILEYGNQADYFDSLPNQQ